MNTKMTHTRRQPECIGNGMNKEKRVMSRSDMEGDARRTEKNCSNCKYD